MPRGGARKGAGRPPLPNAKRRVTACVYPAIIRALDQAAERRGVSRSAMVNVALAAYFYTETPPEREAGGEKGRNK